MQTPTRMRMHGRFTREQSTKGETDIPCPVGNQQRLRVHVPCLETPAPHPLGTEGLTFQTVLQLDYDSLTLQTLQNQERCKVQP